MPTFLRIESIRKKSIQITYYHSRLRSYNRHIVIEESVAEPVKFEVEINNKILKQNHSLIDCEKIL